MLVSGIETALYGAVNLEGSKKSRVSERLDRLSLAAYVFVLVNLFGFSYLLVHHTEIYRRLQREDGWCEYAGCFFLLLTGLYLAAAAWRQARRRGPQRRWAAFLIVGSLLFLWAAGEEISWGQRLLGLETPPVLAELNEQGELNLHNVAKRFFDRGVRHVTTLLVVISAISCFRGHSRLLGLRLPDMLLTLAFLMLPCYVQYDHWSPEYQFGFLFLGPCLVYYRRRSDVRMIAATLAALFTIIFVIAWHARFNHLFISNNTNEVREHLFSVLCFVYAVQLFRDAGTAAGRTAADAETGGAGEGVPE